MKVLIFLILIFLASCKSAPLKVPPPPQGYAPLAATQLTFLGESSEPAFSADDKKIIYQNKKRPNHENSQVYVVDIATKVEKRITHNDGDDSCASYSHFGTKIIYSSTTDEIKERAAELSKAGRNSFLPFEIYSADIDGSHIRRLTKTPGYDAEGRYSRAGDKIIFTSFRGGNSDIYVMNSNGRNIRKISNNHLPNTSPMLSNNSQKIVYVAAGHLYIANTDGSHAVQLTTGENINNSPYWHPNSKKIIFSSNRADKNNYELYTISVDGKCLKRITYSTESEYFPSFSRDGKKIAFTSNKTGKNQIYVTDFSEPLDCQKN